jgi:hypothetical protein
MLLPAHGGEQLAGEWRLATMLVKSLLKHNSSNSSRLRQRPSKGRTGPQQAASEQTCGPHSWRTRMGAQGVTGVSSVAHVAGPAPARLFQGGFWRDADGPRAGVYISPGRLKGISMSHGFPWRKGTGQKMQLPKSLPPWKQCART